MPTPAVLRHLPKHRGTGRLCSLVDGALARLEPPELSGERYILLVVAGADDPVPSISLARRWIDAGTSYVCAWGAAAPEVEEAFDYATFLPEVGQELNWTLMTTQHSGESLEEALWFAFYTAAAPDDLKAEIRRVVIAAGTPGLARTCEHWVRANTE